MAELNKSGRVNVSDKFLYIEPNDSFGADVNSSVPLEKLCIYVDLVVEYQSRESITMKTTNAETITMRYSVGGKDNENSIFGNEEFLSTKGYGNYTFLDINNEGTSELFGIESINIAYNSFMVPEVNIQFVDIKGAALHGAEELAHDEDGKLENDINISDDIKFLSCFFTLPYPRFRLIVKGFYGNPLSYDLMCAEFKSSFESKTGDYKATAKMVGYSFGLISDVSICSLMAAPYSSYYGKKYWEEQEKNGRFKFDNGADLLTMSEVVSTWYYRMGELGDIDTEAYNNDNSYTEKLQEVNDQLVHYENATLLLISYLTYIVDAFKDIKVIAGCEYYDKSSTIVCVTLAKLWEGKYIGPLWVLKDTPMQTQTQPIKLASYDASPSGDEQWTYIIPDEEVSISDLEITLTSRTVEEDEMNDDEDMDFDKDGNWKHVDKYLGDVEKFINDIKTEIGDGFYSWDKIMYWERCEKNAQNYSVETEQGKKEL
jgi:hypothetical protein